MKSAAMGSSRRHCRVVARRPLNFDYSPFRLKQPGPTRNRGAWAGHQTYLSPTVLTRNDE
jgi:hypothetical protein